MNDVTLKIPEAAADALWAAMVAARSTSQATASPPPVPAPTGAPATPAPAAPAYDAWPAPRLTMVKGTQMLLKAPLNPRYVPAMSASIFGHPPSFVYDPSNAPEGKALRSPNGWPLFYTSPDNGQPRLVNGDQTFADDAAVDSYMVRVAAMDADNASRPASTAPAGGFIGVADPQPAVVQGTGNAP